MDLPTEFAKWAYGRWFVGHPIVGFIIVASILSMFVSGVFALFWLRGVDKYNETQPMPISKNETQPKPIPKNGKAIDGWMGTVLYMFASGTQAEDTFIKIWNNSNVNAAVAVDITPDAGGTVKGVNLGTIPAGTIAIFWAGSGVGSIAALAGLPVGIAFGAVFTVNAPKDSVIAMVNQKRPGGQDRSLPIQTGTHSYKTD